MKTRPTEEYYFSPAQISLPAWDSMPGCRIILALLLIPEPAVDLSSFPVYAEREELWLASLHGCQAKEFWTAARSGGYIR